MSPTPFQKLLAGHVLQTLALAHQQGQPMTLDDLVSAVQARRVDVRTVVTRLHQEGYVDAVKMRLTMKGFIAGASLEGVELKPLRRPEVAVVRAA